MEAVMAWHFQDEVISRLRLVAWVPSLSLCQIMYFWESQEGATGNGCEAGRAPAPGRAAETAANRAVPQTHSCSH